MSRPTLLIVEDDPLLALDAAAQAERAGYQTIMTASVADAQRVLALEDIDAALLDFLLSDGVVTPVAHALREAGLPYAIVSGSSMAEIEQTGLLNPPLMAKPADYLRVISNLMRDEEMPRAKTG